MQIPRLPFDEAERIVALHAARLMQAAPDETFDRITRMAARHFGVPIALISFVDKDKRAPDKGEGAFDMSICSQDLLSEDLLVVPDAGLDKRFARNPAGIGEPPVRFYAGATIRSADMRPIGMLCLIDHVPRTLGDEDAVVLKDMARTVEDVIHQRELASASTSLLATLYSQDAAYDAAKMRGPSIIQEYQSEPPHPASPRLALEHRLRRAVDRNELTLHYQPKVDLRSGKVAGVEALMRWIDPEFGTVSPVEFIPLAEENGLIVPIGEWLLRTACAQLRAWHDEGLPAISVAVNLSSGQFLHNDILATVRDAITHTRLPAEFLELELTESVSMGAPEKSAALMRGLKDLGVSLSIDDFGTGYSSLSYLKRLPIDKVKIDRSFVMDMVQSEESLTIVQAIIAMAHRLKLKVVAEGVETEKQLAYLGLNLCDEIQGYYFSRPLLGDACRQLLLEGKQLAIQEAARLAMSALLACR